jgi:DNA replication protein DnaC
MTVARTDLDHTRSLLADTGFEFVPEIIPELIERGIREDMSHRDFLEVVLTREHEAREERRIRTNLKLSGLASGKTLEEFDYTFQRGIEKRRIEMLSTCEFARNRENILFLGPPGVGKTHLATGIGVRAIQNGFSVSYMTADELIDRLRRDSSGAHRSRNQRRKYMRSSVLIIDELGFQAMTREDAHLLFKVISYRYEKGSTIITSNKSIREWPDMLAGDEVLATALLDRLLHHCNVVNIDGRSFRLRQIEERILKTE